MATADARLIVALDLPSRAEAQALVDRLGDSVSFYKIGLQLLALGGMELAAALKARGLKVFADWKLHDIGATVEKATAAVAGTGACDFITVHAEPQVLAGAVRGRAGSPLKILGVTVMTSLDDKDLVEIGYGLGVKALVSAASGNVWTPARTASSPVRGRPPWRAVWAGPISWW